MIDNSFANHLRLRSFFNVFQNSYFQFEAQTIISNVYHSTSNHFISTAFNRAILFKVRVDNW